MIAHIDKGKGRPVLLLHGLFGSGVYWSPLIATLSRTRRVIAPDLPGFGKSAGTPVPADIAGFAAVSVDLLDALGVGSADVVGYSMGGLVAQQLALDAPERIRRLVNYATKPMAADADRFEPFNQTLAELDEKPVQEVATANITRWFKHPPPPEAWQLCLDALRGTQSAGAIAALQAVDGWDIRERLGQIAAPVLVVSGDSDRSVSLENMLMQFNLLGAAQLCVLPDCGHVAHLERPGLFATVLRSFLDASQTEGRTA